MLKEKKQDDKTKTGIVIPESADIEPTHMGEVVGVGEATSGKVKVGDTVIFRTHMFDEIGYNDEMYRFGKEENIFAVIS